MPAARKSTKAKSASAKGASRKTLAKKGPASAKAKKATAVKKGKIAAKPATTRKVKVKAAAAQPKRKASPVSFKSKLTKTQILKEIAQRTQDLNQKQVAFVFESLHELVQGSVGKGGCGEFAIPSIGVKIRRIKKKATKPRWGRNPATGEQVWIEAKPARQVIKVTALKSLKQALEGNS